MLGPSIACWTDEMTSILKSIASRIDHGERISISFPLHVLGEKEYPSGQTNSVEWNLTYVPFIKSRTCLSSVTVYENRRSEIEWFAEM